MYTLKMCKTTTALYVKNSIQQLQIPSPVSRFKYALKKLPPRRKL